MKKYVVLFHPFVVLLCRDMTVDRDTVSKFLREDSASAEILKEMAAEAKNEDLAVSTVHVKSHPFFLEVQENGGVNNLPPLLSNLNPKTAQGVQHNIII